MLVTSPWYEKKIAGPQISYRINKDGFRSDHFEQLNSQNYNVLVGGCSYTFGEGMLEDRTWTNLLKNNIQNTMQKNVKFFNTGFMGSSIDLVIKNIMGFIKNYGAPDIIFILFPDIGRQVRFDENRNHYRRMIAGGHWIENAKDTAQISYTMNYLPQNNLLTHVQLIQMLEAFCEAKKIKLIWSTWETFNDANMYKILDFKYFLDIPDVSQIDRVMAEKKYNDTKYGHLINNDQNIPYWNIGEDGNHPGFLIHKYMSDYFFDAFVGKIKLWDSLNDNPWN